MVNISNKPYLTYKNIERNKIIDKDNMKISVHLNKIEHRDNVKIKKIIFIFSLIFLNP